MAVPLPSFHRCSTVQWWHHPPHFLVSPHMPTAILSLSLSPPLSLLPPGGAKMAAIGVRVTRWVSFHGVAINVCPDMHPFSLIRPCGLSRPVTSLEALLRRTPADGDVAEARRAVDRRSSEAELVAVQAQASLSLPGMEDGAGVSDSGAHLHEAVGDGTPLQSSQSVALPASASPSLACLLTPPLLPTELDSALVAAGQPWHASEEERRLMDVAAQEVLAAFSRVFEVDVVKVET